MYVYTVTYTCTGCLELVTFVRIGSLFYWSMPIAGSLSFRDDLGLDNVGHSYLESWDLYSPV